MCPEFYFYSFIFSAGWGGGRGLPNLTLFTIYISYFQFFALDILVCFILYFAFTSTSFFMFTLFRSFFPAIAGQYFWFLRVKFREDHF